MNIPQAVRPHLITPGVRDKHWSPALAAAQQQDADIDLGLDELATPALTLDLDGIKANITAMRDWVAERGAVLAPHGKTSMCPALWHWQLAEGAWAITVANEAQLRVARDARVPRVIVANELLSPAALKWLAAELNADPSFEVIAWVDSLAGVQIMTQQLIAAGLARPLPVCVEVGAWGGRSGVRTREQAIDVAEAVGQSPVLSLQGVSAYEGAAPAEDGDKLAAVDAFLKQVAAVASDIVARCEIETPIITAGGSAYFDRVCALLGPAADATGSWLVLRSGSYVVHDDGLYRDQTPSATRQGPQFTAAAHVWAQVLSVPEPGLALLDAGKRDVPYDARLPTPQLVLREQQRVAGLPTPIGTIIDTNDQHAYVRLEQPGSVAVGDLVKLGLSHPCTIFDKWRSALLTESESPRIRGVVPTYF